MYKKIVWIVALASSIAFSQTVLADSCGCGKGMQEMLSELKLDAAQKTKIDGIMSQMKSNMKTIWAQKKDLDKQINQQVNSDKMDTAAMNSLVDQKTKLIGDTMKAKHSAQNQIMAVLTPAQKTMMQNKMQAREDQMETKFKNCHD